jgi:hypothetical protein
LNVERELIFQPIDISAHACMVVEVFQPEVLVFQMEVFSHKMVGSTGGRNEKRMF